MCSRGNSKSRIRLRWGSLTPWISLLGGSWLTQSSGRSGLCLTSPLLLPLADVGTCSASGAAPVRPATHLRCRSGPSRRVLLPPSLTGRGNIVATRAPPDASDVSANPRKLDDLHASGHICAACTRLRALWGDFPVVVRVHSGALEAPANTLVSVVLFMLPRTARADRRQGDHRFRAVPPRDTTVFA